MGNFEKLSVLVIVVIIVMILVVALYTWTDSSDPSTAAVAGAPTDSMVEEPVVREKTKPVKETGAKGKAETAPSDALAKIFDDWPLTSKVATDKPTAPPKDGGEGGVAPPTPPPAPVGPQYVNYVVKDGDTLGKIAQDHLGGTSKWPEIIKANDGLDPLKLRQGMTIRLPVKGSLPADSGDKSVAKDGAPSGSAKPGGTYSVSRGETLETIAKKVYGTKNRWPEIWVANLALLDDPGDIKGGMTLQLPK